MNCATDAGAGLQSPGPWQPLLQDRLGIRVPRGTEARERDGAFRDIPARLVAGQAGDETAAGEAEGAA